MNYRKILFPTDFSECSDAALEMATSMALETGATLLIVHVKEHSPPHGGEWYIDASHANDDLMARLESVVPKDQRVANDHRLITGSSDPASAIVRCANDEKVDEIVMGTHGRTGLMRMLMGSVAEDVVRHATCPVLTVKQHKIERIRSEELAEESM